MRYLIPALALLTVFARWGAAEPITDPAALGADVTLIDFENLGAPGQLVTSVPNPLTIGNATFRSLTGSLSIFDISLAGWAADGTEVASKTLFPGGEPDSAISIDFAIPVAGVVVGWGDPNFVGNVLLAYNSTGQLLESASVALGQPGGGHAAWLGFSRSSADITRIVVQPDQSLPSGDDYVIDHVAYAVPEPSAGLLLSHGLLVSSVAYYRRRWCG